MQDYNFLLQGCNVLIRLSHDGRGEQMIYLICQSNSFHILTQANLGAVDLIQTQPTLKHMQINLSASVNSQNGTHVLYH